MRGLSQLSDNKGVPIPQVRTNLRWWKRLRCRFQPPLFVASRRHVLVALCCHLRFVLPLPYYYSSSLSAVLRINWRQLWAISSNRFSLSFQHRILINRLLSVVSQHVAPLNEVSLSQKVCPSSDPPTIHQHHLRISTVS
jgi:hypothetical protein